MNAVSESLHVVFLTAVPILVVAFLLTLLIKEVPLRTKARGIPAQDEPVGSEVATDLGGATPVEVEVGSGAALSGRGEPARCRGRLARD